MMWGDSNVRPADEVGAISPRKANSPEALSRPASGLWAVNFNLTKSNTESSGGDRMARVLCNVMFSDWSVHFIAPDGRTRIGPWLLLDSHEEVRAILRWGNITAEELEVHENSIRRWSVSSAVLHLTEQQLGALIERGRGWPWNGYELRLMKEAGRYPPARLPVRKRVTRQRFLWIRHLKPSERDKKLCIAIYTLMD
jgi:hypothetical protein